MKFRHIPKFLETLYEWHIGDKQLWEVVMEMDDDSGWLKDVLFKSGVISYDGRPLSSFSYQGVVNCILIALYTSHKHKGPRPKS